MADEKATSSTAETTDAPAPRKGSGKLMILVLVSAAMIGEAGLFYFLGIGSGGGEVAAADPTAPKPDDAKAGAGKESRNEQLVEVEIHSVNVTNNNAAADTIVHISFKLHALVASDQKSAFEDAVKTNQKARVREAVEKIARSATLEDLNDSNLSTLKRLLREEVNKVLRQSYVIEVAINDFKTMQQ